MSDNRFAAFVFGRHAGNAAAAAAAAAAAGAPAAAEEAVSPLPTDALLARRDSPASHSHAAATRVARPDTRPLTSPPTKRARMKLHAGSAAPLARDGGGNGSIDGSGGGGVGGVGGGPGEKLGDGAPLRLIVIGHNPSEASWAARHFYAHPANRMWPILIKTGLAPPGATGPADDDRSPQEAGVGFTDLGTGHPGTDSSQFSSQVLLRWRSSLYARLRAHLECTAAAIGCTCGRCGAPNVVAFSGKRQFVELFSGRSTVTATGKAPPRSKRVVQFGRQDELPEGWPLPVSTEVWVMPSTSGAAPMSTEMREAPYRLLAERVLREPWPRAVTPLCGAPSTGGAAPS